MKTCFLASAVASISIGYAVPPLISRNDAQVLRVVLESSTIPTVVQTVDDPTGKSIVISDVTTKCQLPIDAQERERQRKASDRITPRLERGESVDLSELWLRPFSADHQLVVGPGKTVPKEMVLACRTSAVGTVPRLDLAASVRVVFERGAVVEREFRKDRSRRWNLRHPTSIGLVVVARPVYSTDLAAAGVYVYHFLSGWGGGGSFCFLKRDGGTWRIQWEDTIWFE
jgi:hypothetical protein